MKNDAAVEIIHFADPWCSWSWSLEPILNRLREVYGNQIKITYKMGGVSDDFNEWRKHYDAVSDEDLRKWFAEALKDGKMPFDVEYVLKTKVKSTFPACIAFKAAELQGEELAHKFFRRMMENADIECKNISDEKIYLKIAKEAGLDVDRLRKDAKSDKARKMFEKDQSEMSVNFLTLAFVDPKTKKGVVVGEVFEPNHYEHADSLHSRNLAGSFRRCNVCDGMDNEMERYSAYRNNMAFCCNSHLHADI